ncbi:MAG TPA: hypothetical protein VES68_00655, partial [Candidatus Sulfotelmatobacter sp.]|nr:hypothetical protein [Candidatus Sulfotelmatobacter sp.]
MNSPELTPKVYDRESHAQKLLEGQEFAGLKTWYEERLKTFPEYEVTDSDLTDGTNWKAKLTPE